MDDIITYLVFFLLSMFRVICYKPQGHTLDMDRTSRMLGDRKDNSPYHRMKITNAAMVFALFIFGSSMVVFGVTHLDDCTSNITLYLSVGGGILLIAEIWEIYF